MVWTRQTTALGNGFARCRTKHSGFSNQRNGTHRGLDRAEAFPPCPRIGTVPVSDTATVSSASPSQRPHRGGGHTGSGALVGKPERQATPVSDREFAARAVQQAAGGPLQRWLTDSANRITLPAHGPAHHVRASAPDKRWRDPARANLGALDRVPDCQRALPPARRYDLRPQRRRTAATSHRQVPQPLIGIVVRLAITNKISPGVARLIPENPIPRRAATPPFLRGVSMRRDTRMTFENDIPPTSEEEAARAPAA